jgi:tetrapyrrole methylase family protein / MazG family protein
VRRVRKEPLLVQPPKDLRKFDSLLQIIEALRGPEGCPWDKEQTHRTLTPFAIEEAHELAEAIESGDESEMVSELGDLLLQVVLHAEIGRQAGRFDITDVVHAISEKMVRRHPHVFSDTKVKDSAEVLANWSALKAQEKRSSPGERFDIAPSLPALARAHKIGDKTRRLRFDWADAKGVMEKVEEELEEIRQEFQAIAGDAPTPAQKKAIEHEIGDALFSLAQLARHLGLEAEQCLRTTNARFEKRFFTMRKMIEESGRDYDSLTPEELESAWQSVKARLDLQG